MANILSHPYLASLGNTAYGIYLFQHYGYINRIGYPNFPLFIFYLTLTGAFGYHCVQLPSKDFFLTHGLRVLALWRCGPAAKVLTKAWSWIETDFGRMLTVCSFFLAAASYVRTTRICCSLSIMSHSTYRFRHSLTSPRAGQLATMSPYPTCVCALFHDHVPVVP